MKRVIRSRWFAFAAGMLVGLGAWLAASLLERRPGDSRAAFSPPMDMERPIAARDSVWVEDLTWLEVRDAMQAGARSVIIATGGIEQNGPYVVAGKHNLILRGTAEAIARKLGNTLVAPIIPFVPEGDIEPPSGHMRYPATISLGEDTYRSMVRDIAASFKVHGFSEIILIGDSGKNQPGLKDVADKLAMEWRKDGVKVWYIPEYYDWGDRAQWLAGQGFVEKDEGFHDELSVESIILAVDPDGVRAKERMETGKFSINGIDLAPIEKSQTLGRKLIDHIAQITVEAIHDRRARDGK